MRVDSVLCQRVCQRVCRRVSKGGIMYRVCVCVCHNTHTVFVSGTINGVQQDPERHLVNELGFDGHGAVLGVADFRIAAPEDCHVGAGHTEQSAVTIHGLDSCVEEGCGGAVRVQVDHVEAGQGVAAPLVHEHDRVPGVDGRGGVSGGGNCCCCCCCCCWFFR